MERVYLTREGYEKLEQEIEHLRRVKRREISKALEHARSLGDLRENAEYNAAKEALAQNEQRIAALADKLSRAQIVDELKISPDKAYIGARLILHDLDTNEKIEYTLVSPDEASPPKGLISTTSPVGKALLGHKRGDTVKIRVPAGELKYKILEISR
ncbi:MAG: transcription elongation factor GreA [Candidatus Omnitrophota bacterium]|nr:MAG: transcription elongation factor GreA [Candidatus Omnitrophota bacterium]